MPTVSVSCWQAMALATHSNIVGKRGGFEAAKPVGQGPEVADRPRASA